MALLHTLGHLSDEEAVVQPGQMTCQSHNHSEGLGAEKPVGFLAK
jgi:hypothetical protein